MNILPLKSQLQINALRSKWLTQFKIYKNKKIVNSNLLYSNNNSLKPTIPEVRPLEYFLPRPMGGH